MPASSPSPERSRSRALFLLLVLTVVAAALAVHWLLLGDDSLGGTTTRDGAARSHATGETTSGNDGDESSRSAADATRQTDLPAPAVASGPRTLPALDWKPGPSSGFPVHVVDAKTRRPIPGAHVAVVVLPPNEASARFDDLAPRVLAGAVGYLADSRGWARVEWPPVRAFVLGVAGDRCGARELVPTGREDFELPLAPWRTIDVEVVSRRGEPIAGARVAWAIRDSAGKLVPSARTVTTDARGRVRLDGSEEGEAVAGVEVPWFGKPQGDPAAFVPIDATTVGPLRCVVGGDCGSLEVRLLDGRGHPIDAPVELQFGVFTAHADGELLKTYSRSLPGESATLADSRGRFAPVPLDLQLEVQAHWDTGWWATATGHGPQKDGEVARIDVKSKVSNVMVRGRIVGAEQPTSVIAIRNAVEVPVAVRMGEGHRFELDCSAFSPAFGALRLCGIDAATGDAFSGDFAAPAPSETGEVDVGDVTVRAIPITAAGRVVTEARDPLSGVLVSRVGSSETRRTDATGRFLFIGSADESRITLAVAGPNGFADATLEVPPGSRDVEIVMLRSGALVGRLLADRAVSLLVRPHQGGAPVYEHDHIDSARGRVVIGHVSRLDEPPSTLDRPFRFELPPGRYDLFVSLGGAVPEAALLSAVNDLEVNSGATTCDPRANPLDLRGTIGRWHVTLSRSDGAPPPSLWVRLAPDDRSDEFMQTIYLGGDGASIDSALPSAWVDVAHPGFRHIHELHQRGDVKLVLEPVESHPFVVHVAAPSIPRAAGIVWRVHAEPSWTNPVEGLEWFIATADGDGDARLDLDEGESWKVHLYATVQQKDGEQRFEIARLARALDEHDLEKGSIELRPDVDDVEAALASIDLKH